MSKRSIRKVRHYSPQLSFKEKVLQGMEKSRSKIKTTDLESNLLIKETKSLTNFVELTEEVLNHD